MPRIPTYEGQLGVARATPATIESAATYMPFVRETERTGAMLQARGEQLLKEYDNTRAYDAFNTMRDSSRAKVAELLQREGANAQGVQGEYEEWAKQSRSSISKEKLSTFSQTEMFNRLSDQRRAADLDHLANHEATQHKIYKTEVIKGLANVTERDIRGAAYDDDKMDGMIGVYFAAIDGLFPGHDNSTDKISAMQTFRVSAMDELINTNPQYAGKKIEEWRTDLGEKYAPLKKRLETQLHDNRLGDAFGALNERFGNNHEAKIAFVNNKSNWEKLGPGFDYKDAKELDNRFSGMLADRERAINAGEAALKRNQDAYASKVMQSLYDPSAPKQDVHDLHKRRLISDAVYEHAIKARENTTIDNYWKVFDLHDKIRRGIDVTDEIRVAVEDGILSEKSGADIGKHQTNEKSKRAMQYIDRALKPSEADKWSPDKHLKYADATRLYYAKIAGGMDYEQAAYEVVKGYIDSVRRTLRGLRTPEGLTDEQKTDLTALEQSKAVIVEKLRSKQITPEVYREQMNNIDNLIKIAVEEQQAGTMDAELEAIRKRKLQK